MSTPVHFMIAGKRLPKATGTLTMPAYPTVKLGTLHAIFTQAVRFVPDAELRHQFYTD